MDQNWTGIMNYFDVTYPLEKFREYSQFIEQSLNKEVQVYEKMASQYIEEEQEDFWDWHIDEVTLYFKDFPSIMRTSLVTSVYAFLEKKLVELCVPGPSGEIFNSAQSGDAIINNAKRYIKSVLNKDFPSDIFAWQYIQNVREIRNCLVHNAGRIDDLEETREAKLRRIIVSMPQVEIDNHDNIFLHKEFCTDFIEYVEEILNILYK